MAENPREEMESKIREAMLSRLNDFKSQADNLTMEGVRRALEKELGLERLSLDAYKKFIKQCVEKYFNGDDENASEAEAKAKIEEPSRSTEEKEGENKKGDLINSSSDINKNSEESEMSHESPGHNKEISDDIIKKAIRKRAAYFRGNLEITLLKVRRLLEEDLKLEKGSLDAHKKLISTELDKTLQLSDVVENTNSTMKKQMKTSNKKVSKKINKDSDSNSDEEEGKDEDNEAVKRTKKRPAQKIINDTKASKKQKVSVEKKKTPLKKRPAEEDSDKSDECDHGKPKAVAKKQSEKPTPVYGRKVERLRSIIKSCGLGIPPAAYKRAKQAPESEREAGLIKELADILQKEGLSTDPSEKEIQEVKKRKQRAKDLEGIDMSNIVSSSRRRSSSYIPIPPPKIEDSESDEEGEKDEDDDEENEEDSEIRVSDAEDSEDGASDAEDSNAGSGDEAEDESD